MWVRQLNCYLDTWWSCSATLSAIPSVFSLPLPLPHEFSFSSQFAQGSLPPQVYQGCCATCPCYITKASRTASLVYLRGQAHTNTTYLRMPVIETIEFWKFLKYFNMVLLKIGPHVILPQYCSSVDSTKHLKVWCPWQQNVNVWREKREERSEKKQRRKDTGARIKTKETKHTM